MRFINVKLKKINLFILSAIFVLSFEVLNAQKIAAYGDFYKLKKVIKVDGRQGIAADDEYYYVSSSVGLYKYTKDGELVAKNEDPFKNIDKDVNHFGDIDIKGDSIITGAEHFDSGEAKNIQIAIYDAEDLSLKEAIDFEDMEQPEVAGVCIDKKRNHVWMVDWINGDYIYQYDISSKKYLGKVHLQPSPQWQQGCIFTDDNILISADDGDADLKNKESDNIYRINVANPNQTYTDVHKYREMDDFIRDGEIEGISIDPTNHDLLVHNNRGAIIKMGMPSGFYPGYDEEIHEIYVYKIIK